MLKILQISDLHLMGTASDTLLGVDTEYYFCRVLEQAHTRHGPFDLLLLTGDLAQQPSETSYRRLLSILQTYPGRGVCLPGNHDDLPQMLKVLNTAQISCQRYLPLKNWQIICLNSQQPGSAAGELAAAELQFLQQRLQAEPDAPTLIALHHHCISSGSPWMDTMQIHNSGDLLAIVDQHPQVKIITFGHVHQEINNQYGDIGIFSTPATCFQFLPFTPKMAVTDESPGYRLFELHEDGSFNTACYRITEPLLVVDHSDQGY
jgi:Icc protein